MIRAILFDIDDTLITFDPAGAANAFHAGARKTYDYLHSRNLPLPSFDKFYRRHCAMTWRARFLARLTGRERGTRHILRKLCLRLRLQRDEVSLARLGWLWYEPLLACSSVAPDVIPTLTALADAGLRLGLVCNTPLQGEVIDKHLDIEGLLGFFPVRIYSSDVAWRKPDRRIFEVALHELAVRPAETLHVGDSARTDIAGANKAGLTSVLLQRNTDPAIPAPAHTITRLADLLALPAVADALEQRALRIPLPTPASNSAAKAI